LKREDRLPTLVFSREIPIEGEPADVSAVVNHYGGWLAQSNLPKRIPTICVANFGNLLGKQKLLVLWS
jgi:hypothetical protein